MSEEIQKTARLLFRLFLSVCALLCALGVNQPGPDYREFAIEELRTLQSIPWDEYQANMELAQRGVLYRGPEDPMSPEEDRVARNLETVVPKIGKVVVVAPRRLLGIERARMEQLFEKGTIAEYELALRNQLGVRELRDPHLPFTAESVRRELNNAFGQVSAPGEVLVRFEVDPLSIEPANEGAWRASVSWTMEYRPAGNPEIMPARVTGAEFEVALEEAGTDLPGSRLGEWLSETRPEDWGRIWGRPRHNPRGNRGSATLFPHLKLVWSSVSEKRLEEAEWEMISRVLEDPVETSLLGVPIPAGALSIAGPLVLCYLLVYLLVLLVRMTGLEAPEESSLVWVHLSPRPSVGLFGLALASLFAWPLLSLWVFWSYQRRLAMESPLGPIYSPTAFLADNAFGLILSVVVLALGLAVLRVLPPRYSGQ